jgi:phage/plasmid-like protein (TIGR03299 family)
MPAEVETAFTVREPAWWDTAGEHDHDAYPSSIAQAREWAGQAWEAVEAPNFRRVLVHDPATFAFLEDDEVITDSQGAVVAVYRPIAGEKRIERSDNGQHILTVPTSYEVIGVGEMWNIVEAVAQGGDEANARWADDLQELARHSGVKFETGGVLKDSKRIWALARLDEPWHAPGDPSETYPYIAFLNSFDRLTSAKAVNTTVRVVCANTFGAADAQGRATGREFTFRHTQGVHDRIQDATAALQGLRADTKAWQELAGRLALERVSPRQAELFVAKFIPMPPEGLISDRVVANVEEARGAVRGILAGKTCEGINGSAYGLVQAAGEYLDHVRGFQSRETYLQRTLLRPEKLKAKAIRLAREVQRETV